MSSKDRAARHWYYKMPRNLHSFLFLFLSLFFGWLAGFLVHEVMR